ncbi:MAG: PepSY domain-containing protein [Alphaproteobacteria bacterium]
MRELMVVVPTAFLLVSGAMGVTRADENDHERAREALQAGQVRPLKDIVGSVQRRCGGRVIEVELEERPQGEGHQWLYELRMLMPKGDVLGLELNAATAEILGVKGRGASRACQ